MSAQLADDEVARFVADVRRNPKVALLLDRWDAFALPDGWLVAGCLFQTVWNLRSGRPPEEGIADYDLFYFDASDLSAEAEGGVQRRVEAALQGAGIAVEAKNQTRVHTWYEAHFGFPYPRLQNAQEGIDRFLVASTCVGLQPQADGSCRLHAPNGLADLEAGRLTPNPLTPHEALFREKALSYQRRWPRLRIVDVGHE